MIDENIENTQKILQEYYFETENQESSFKQGKLNSIGNEEKYQYLNRTLEQIAQDGQCQQYNWIHLRHYLVIRILKLLDQMHQKFHLSQISNENYLEQKEEIILYIYEFNSEAPFTMQRICELILKPETYYNSIKKMIYAFEKLVSVSQP